VDECLKAPDSRPVIFELLPSLTFPFGGSQLESWFASPETWTIDAAPESLTSNPGRFTLVELQQLLKKVVHWLKEWIEHGSNPFIHQQLYRHRLPQSIQDAYLSLSAYFGKNISNEHLIFRIIEDRVTRLVADGVPSSDFFDALEYFARVQALLVYQCIGLYDGNIRLRHLAEQHIPVLEFWMVDLLQQISRNPDCSESLFNPPQRQPSQMSPPVTHIPSEDLLWYTYIITESVRRTWLVTAGVQGLYNLIQCGKGSCMGGTIFTSRSGFWEAKSAVAWEKRCCDVYAGLVRLTEVDKMFALVPRKEICDFAKVVLQCTYGREQVERWGLEV
jgi:hypothetical protein